MPRLTPWRVVERLWDTGIHALLCPLKWGCSPTGQPAPFLCLDLARIVRQVRNHQRTDGGRAVHCHFLPSLRKALMVSFSNEASYAWLALITKKEPESSMYLMAWASVSVFNTSLCSIGLSPSASECFSGSVWLPQIPLILSENQKFKTLVAHYYSHKYFYCGST